MSQPMHAFSTFLLRLAGHVPGAGDEAPTVFRSFAESMERRVSGVATDGPKIRVAGGDGTGAWR